MSRGKNSKSNRTAEEPNPNHWVFRVPTYPPPAKKKILFSTAEQKESPLDCSDQQPKTGLVIILLTAASLISLSISCAMFFFGFGLSVSFFIYIIGSLSIFFIFILFVAMYKGCDY